MGSFIEELIESASIVKDHYELLKSEKTSLIRNILREVVHLYARVRDTWKELTKP